MEMEMTYNPLTLGPVTTLAEIADRLDKMPANDDATASAGFDMEEGDVTEDTRHPCGTAACIGGWVKHWNGLQNRLFDNAVSELGIPYKDAVLICSPPNNHPGWHATGQQAASLLRHYIATGVVDWDLAMGAKK